MGALPRAWGGGRRGALGAAGVGHTRAFDDTTTWLAAPASTQAVRELLRTAWAMVGPIVARVAGDAEAAWDRFEGLRRIGIDELSDKQGHRDLLVVVDHDRRRLVWAAPGRDQATLRGVFDLLGPERWRQAPAGARGRRRVGRHGRRRALPGRQVVPGPVACRQVASDALDEVRRQVWNTARQQGDTALARQCKGARFAFWKHPEDRTGRQRGKLAWIARVNARRSRA